MEGRTNKLEFLTIDMLPVSPGRRGFASRSQENLVDAMSKERFRKGFPSRGQSSTLPLNYRPPPTQRRSSTFRNMFQRFRKSKRTIADPSLECLSNETSFSTGKPSTPSIKEIPEYNEEEVQSITSRDTGVSEPGKKRGFFSRLFRRSRKH